MFNGDELTFRADGEEERPVLAITNRDEASRRCDGLRCHHMKHELAVDFDVGHFGLCGLRLGEMAVRVRYIKDLPGFW